MDFNRYFMCLHGREGLKYYINKVEVLFDVGENFVFLLQA